MSVDVLIVGAGPTGLMLANQLCLQFEMQPTMVDAGALTPRRGYANAN